MPRFAQSVLLNTGPVVALINRADRHHVRALGWFRDFRGRLVTTEAVVTEVAYVLGKSSRHQEAALLWLARMAKSGLLAIEPMSDLAAIAKIMKRYASLPADFADASLVWLALTRRVNRVATIDEADFAIYRAYAGKPFVNVFVGSS